MGVETVDASRYDVTTQERWLRPPRSPTIVGSAVETIVWSSAARNMPSMSAAKTVQSARPWSRPSSAMLPPRRPRELGLGQRRRRQRARRLGAEPVKQEAEVPAPVVRRDGGRRLDHAAVRPEDEREILSREVGPERALLLRPLDQPPKRRPDPLAHRLRALPAVLAREHVLEPPVRRVPGERLLEKPGEAGPGVVRGGRLLRQANELREGVLEHRVDEVLLRREVAVERSHPDARMPGELLDRDLDAGAGEELPRARDEPLVVAAGVAAQGRRGHDPSMPESGA